jgi:N-acetylmuramoyl-L-alanine amidase CwlA
MEIRQQISDYNHYTYADGARSILYIVVHYTATDAGAANNANYFGSADRQASAHYFVDDSEIVQVVLDKDASWHCGTTGTYYSDCRNSNSIGIEVCTSGSYSDIEVDSAGELVRYLMDLYGIDADHVIRHYDVTHKLCPAAYIDEDAWADLKAVRQWQPITCSNSHST